MVMTAMMILLVAVDPVGRRPRRERPHVDRQDGETSLRTADDPGGSTGPMLPGGSRVGTQRASGWCRPPWSVVDRDQPGPAAQQADERGGIGVLLSDPQTEEE